MLLANIKFLSCLTLKKHNRKTPIIRQTTVNTYVATCRRSHTAIEGLDLEQSSFGRSPPQLITSSPNFNLMQHLVQRSKDAHLSVLHRSCKAHIALVGAKNKLQILHYRGVLYKRDQIKLEKLPLEPLTHTTGHAKSWFW
jgi:hypothetical protein